MRNWKRYLDEYELISGFKDEATSLRVCQLAWAATEKGCYGVGALILDDKREVIVEGHNEVFAENFRSDLHAEMVVVNKFEQSGQWYDVRDKCTLVTSLEPCAMCMSRMILAGIGTVLYVGRDPYGGMVHRRADLPPLFQQISADQSQVWDRADCSAELREAAFRIWNESIPIRERRLIDSAE